jgi:FAD-linked sulfhydryl oxidase
MQYDPTVWGPHFWFFIHTLAHNYPEHPNAITKRKYYDVIQNMPLFIPIATMGDKFAELLDKYPVSPYLDKKDSFVRWTIFIHNKINKSLGKEELSFVEAYDKYASEYKIQPIYLAENFRIKRHHLYFVMILLCILFIYLCN